MEQDIFAEGIVVCGMAADGFIRERDAYRIASCVPSRR